LEIFVTVGIGALFVLSYTAFLQRVPILPIADPLLDFGEPEPVVRLPLV
jgi:hypothetical protein